MPSARAIKAGKAVIELGMPTAAVEKAMKNLAVRAKVIGSQFQAVGRAGMAAGGVITGAFAGAAKVFAGVGDELNKMAARTGASVESLSQLGFAAEQSGASLDAIEKGMKGMARTILDAERGLSTATDNLADLNLSLADLQGKRPEDQFTLIADRISQIEDPTTRAAVAMKVFGRSGAQLLPLFADGTKGMSELRAEAVKLGIVMSEEDAQAAADLTDAFNRVSRQFKMMVVQIGAAVAGPLTDFFNSQKATLKTTIDWVKANGQLVATVAKIGLAVSGASAAIFAIGTAFKAASWAVTGFRVALTLATAHPIVAALAVIGAGVVLLTTQYQKLQKSAEKATASMQEVQDSLQKAAEAGLSQKFPDFKEWERPAPTGPTQGPMTPAQMAAEKQRRDRERAAAEEGFAEFGNMKTDRQKFAAFRWLKEQAMDAGKALGDGMVEGIGKGAAALDGALAAGAKAAEEFAGRPLPEAAKFSEAIFDTRFAAQQFGGGGDKQLREQQRTNKILERIERGGGLNVV